MHYKVIYQTKSQNIKCTVSIYDSDEIKNIVKQLQKGLTSIKGKLVNGLSELNHFEIIKCNYDYIDDKGFHMEDRTISNNGEFIDIPEYSIKLNPNFIPEERDVTSLLFSEANIGHLGDDIFTYKNGLLSVYNEIFPLNKKTKYWEAFDLIFKTNISLNKNILSYTDLYKFFQESSYTNLNNKDLKYTKLRDILKDKIKEIKNHYSMKNDIITLSTTSIRINNKLEEIPHP